LFTSFDEALGESYNILKVHIIIGHSMATQKGIFQAPGRGFGMFKEG